MNEKFIMSFLDMLDNAIEAKIKTYLPIIENEKTNNYEEVTNKKQKDDYLTIDELSRITGLKKATIYAKRSHRELPAYKFGRELRFKRDEIEKWMQSKKQTCLATTERRGR